MRRGFSLVETVVTVALLGVGISACVACMGSATRAAARAEEFTAVQLMAREKLAEIELRPPTEAEDDGDFGEERPGYYWRTRVMPADVAGLRQVKLLIAWGDGEHPRTAEFTTFVLSQ